MIEVEDEDAGLSGWIVIDRVSDGLAAGGIRRYDYASPQEALEEAHRLARAMSVKLASAGLPAGGAKTVILDSEELDVPAAYRALGHRIDEIEPPYLCGPDVGTSETELAYVRETTDRVNPRANEPAERTAAGVLEGIKAALETIEDRVRLDGSRAVVQGFGGVGAALSRRLRREGAMVRVADVDPEARRRAREAGFSVLDPHQVYEEACTVFAPCAVGGVVTEDVAAHIPARIVCGSANEPLASEAAGRMLHERGIAYAPDTLVNVGAVAEGVLTWREGRSKAVLDRVDEVIAGVRDRVKDVLEASREENLPPDEILTRRWG